MTYDAVRFPEHISYGAVGGVLFRTDVVGAESGAEGRVSQWPLGRMMWEVGHGTKTPAQMEELLTFFRARRGRLYAFRFKDWTDYTATAQPLLLTDDLAAGNQTAIVPYRNFPFTVVKTNTPYPGNPVQDGSCYWAVPWGVYDSGTIAVNYTVTNFSNAGGGPALVFQTFDHSWGFASINLTANGTFSSTASIPVMTGINAVAAAVSPLRPNAGIVTMFVEVSGATFDAATVVFNSITVTLHTAAHRQRYQLLKRYDDGVNQEDRYIQAPISAITLLDGVGAATGATVDYTTGLVNISPPPAGTLTWSGEFDFPARFDTDEMRVSIEGAVGGYIGNWQSIPIVEVLIA